MSVPSDANLWKPLLSGRDRERAWEVLARVEQYVDSPQGELGERSPLDRGGTSERPPAVQGVIDTVGAAVFLSYLHPAVPERDLLVRSRRHMEYAAALVENEALPINLFSGFTAVAWAVDHLGKVPWRRSSSSGMEAGEDDLRDVDGYLIDLTSQSPWVWGFDLVSGIVGLGVYATERLPSAAGERILANVVCRLEELAEIEGDKACWFTPPEAIPLNQKEQYPDGYYNLGMAHGMPGIIAILSSAVASGVEESRARSLLEKAVTWLLEQRMPNAVPCVFPGAIVPSTDPMPSRLAWCYGDLGIALALLMAGRNVRVPEWGDIAITISSSCASYELEGSSVVDGSLCHGAFGLMHIFNRLWQATGEERFAKAARYWFGDGYRRVVAHEALEGLKNQRYPDWVIGSGLIMGVSGVGLALLAAVTETEPAWDRVMLMGVTPRGPVTKAERGR